MHTIRLHRRTRTTVKQLLFLDCSQSSSFIGWLNRRSLNSMFSVQKGQDEVDAPNQLYQIVYSSVLSFAQSNGANGGALFWQLSLTGRCNGKAKSISEAYGSP